MIYWNANRKLWIWLSQATHRDLSREEKKGYMAVMKDLWETMGYYDLGLSSQNLRDQAQRLEKMQDRKGEVVRNDIGLKAQGIEWIDRKVY